MTSIMEWITTAFDQAGFGLMALPLAFLLGLASALISACCTLPVFAAIVGYSGAGAESDRRVKLLEALSFMIGTISALLLLGAVSGFVGLVAQNTLGEYWKVFAGFMTITVGLGTLNLLPVKIPRGKQPKSRTRKGGLLGTAFFGFIVGGAITIFSLACNPGIFIIVGVAVLQGYTLWMFGTLLAYAIGFSLPLTALMFGVSIGKSAIKTKKANSLIHYAAGVILVVVGFYFLATF